MEDDLYNYKRVWNKPAHSPYLWEHFSGNKPFQVLSTR